MNLILKDKLLVFNKPSEKQVINAFVYCRRSTSTQTLPGDSIKDLVNTAQSALQQEYVKTLRKYWSFAERAVFYLGF